MNTENLTIDWSTPRSIMITYDGHQVPALMLHEPHSALLYVTMLSPQQRRIAPENQYTVKRRTTKMPTHAIHVQYSYCK